MSDQRYNLRGVSASKEDVHNAIKNIDKGIFPKAFCKIIPDILGGDPETGRGQNLLLRIYIGKKPEIFRFGKGLPKMRLL